MSHVPFVLWTLLGLFQNGTSDPYPTLIQDLSSEQIDKRNNAVRELIRLGNASLPPLERAAIGASDPETRKLIEYALKTIRLKERFGPRIVAFPGAVDRLILGKHATVELLGDVVKLEKGDGGSFALRRRDWGLLIAEASKAASSVEDRRIVLEALALGRCRSGVQRLLEVAKDPDAGLRLAAIEALGRTESVRAVADLVALLKDPDAAVRAAAAVALGKIGERSAVDGLIPLLADRDDGVRSSTAFALGKVGSAEVAAAVASLLRDPDSGVRVSALNALAELRAADVENDIAALLKDKQDTIVVEAAVDALADIGASQTVPQLIACLEENDQELRRKAVRALGRARVSDGVPALEKMISDPHPGVREEAGASLIRLQSKGAGAALIRLLADPNVGVRLMASAALVALRPAGTEADIRKLLTHERADVRAAAVDTVVRMNDRGASLQLIQALEDGDPDVRTLAANGLGQLGIRESGPALCARLSKEGDARALGGLLWAIGELRCGAGADHILSLIPLGGETGDVAAETFIRLGAPGASLRVSPLLTHARDEVRRNAVRILAAAGDAECLPKLIDRLKDQAAAVRLAALEGVGSLGSRASVSDILGSVKDEVPEVRGCAVFQLGQLRAGEALEQAVQGLGDRDAYVRERSLAVLSIINNSRAIDILGGLLASPDDDLRARAVEALDAAGAKSKHVDVARLLEDKSADIRRKAIRALGHLQGSEAGASIRKMLDDDDNGVRSVAADTLGFSGGKDAIQDLVASALEGDLPDAEHALRALHRLGAPDLKEVLAQMAQDDDPALRALAASWLCRMRETQGVRMLIQARRDLFSLNAVRRADVWKRLEHTVWKGGTHGSIVALIHAVAAQSNLQVVWTPRLLQAAWTAPVPTIECLKTQSEASLLEILEELAAKIGAGVILEQGVIRFLPSEECPSFWKTWHSKSDKNPR